MFVQEPPELENTYRSDSLLQSYLDRVVDSERREAIDEELVSLGHLSAGELFDCQLGTLDEEPELVRVSAWGKRVDRIEHTELWNRGRDVAVDYELVSRPYTRNRSPDDRVDQFARVYLFAPSSDTYTCPLAMTDGAARVLLDSGNEELIDRAVPHLTSSNSDTFWTSGQWMTETAGGSDVSRTGTVARRDEKGNWSLHGRKWFTSAIGSDMALTLAKPEGEDDLTLFYVRTRDEDGKSRNFRIERLKDKLGTRELPTGEIVLEGTPARPVDGLGGGVKTIFPMLNVTRTWNAVCSAAGMRRGLQLAHSYARKREVFGEPLAEQPLHASVVKRLEAETRGAFMLAFRAARLLDSDRTGLMRLIVPLAKLYTARQAVTVASETIELFGGAGYVEDTGLPKLIRDAQVLPIWEGTTNVLSLEILRQLAEESGRDVLREAIEKRKTGAKTDEIEDLQQSVLEGVDSLFESYVELLNDPDALEANARSMSFRLARLLEASLLAEQADWNRQKDRSMDCLESARILLSTAPGGPGEAKAAPIGL